MLEAPLPADETARLAALHAAALLDTPAEERFDRITRLLAGVLGAPIAMLSLVADDRLWFKSRFGFEAAQTRRDTSFCAHAIMADDLFVVNDAAEDERFHDNPLVSGDPGIRFYAGRPLHGADGHRLGTLCVLDHSPRTLDRRERGLIEDLASIVEREMQLTDMAMLQSKVIDAQAEIERLLLCIMPAAIARELRNGPRLIAEHFPQATVLFADIEGFSDLAAALAPREMLEWLNSVFSTLDALVQSHGVEKIKTIGDAYMVVAGVPLPRSDHVEAMARLALAMQRSIAALRRPDGTALRMRIGMHCGPVVAGVIGATKFAYDLWGHTVNIASRLEFTAPPGTIQVSDAVRLSLPDSFVLQPRGTLQLKGVGEVGAFLLSASG